MSKNNKKESTRFLWYFIAIGVIILFLLILVNSILSVGDRLDKIAIGPVKLSYLFYGISVLLVYILILRPVKIILFSPAFSVETTLDSPSRKNRLVYKKVAKRLIEQDNVSESVKNQLKDNIDSHILLRETLNFAFNKQIKKEINKKIREHAKTVMISTAISQNGRLDFFAVVTVNIRMIKDIVVMCGFRPNMKNLSKLTLNVFTTAVIAESLENMDIGEILPKNTMSFIGDLPFIKPLVSSVLQGISNALLTLRIGIVTRKYLFSDAKEITKEEIRRGALLEAGKMLPSVVGDGMSMIPKSLWKFFKKKPDEEPTEEVYE